MRMYGPRFAWILFGRGRGPTNKKMQYFSYRPFFTYLYPPYIKRVVITRTFWTEGPEVKDFIRNRWVGKVWIHSFFSVQIRMTGCLNVIFLCIMVCILDPVSFARLFFFRFWRIYIHLGRPQWYESKLTIHHYLHEKSLHKLHTLFHVVMTFCYPKRLRSTTSNPNPQTECPDMHQDEHPKPWKKIAQKLKLCTSSMLRNFSGPFDGDVG